MPVPGCPLSSPILCTLARWWIASYEDGALPKRREIDVSAIRSTLPHIWLVAYFPDTDEFYYRLAGERVNDTFGFSLRGKRLDQVVGAHILETARAHYHHVLQTPGAVHARGRVYSQSGRHCDGERLALPLADDNGTPKFIIGATEYGRQSLYGQRGVAAEDLHEELLSLDDVLAWGPALADRR